MSINLDIDLMWRDLQDTQLNIEDLDLCSELDAELIILEPKIVFMIENYVADGELDFKDQEEFVEALPFLTRASQEWGGVNQNYIDKLLHLVLKIKQRAKF